MNLRHERFSKLVIATSLAAPAISLGQASGTWINPGDGTWTVAANWNSNPLFPNSGGTAVFSQSESNRAITLRSGITLGAIVFNNQYKDTIQGSPSSITLVGPAQIFSGSQAFEDLNRLNVTISGTRGLVKEGPGGLELAANQNNYTGGTTINQGTITIVASELPLSSGSVILNGGALRTGLRSDNPLSKEIFVTAAGGTIDFAIGIARSVASSPISGSGMLSFDGKKLPAFGSFNSYGVEYRGQAALTGTLSVNEQLILSGSFNALSGMEVWDNVFLSDSDGERIADTARITMHGGSIVSGPSNNSARPERVGEVVVDAGHSILGDEHLKFSVDGITRLNRAVLGVGNSGMQISGTRPALTGMGAAGTPGVGILPWGRFESLRSGALSMPAPLTVDGNGAVRTLSPAEYVTALDSPILDQSNVKLTTGVNITAPIRVNSLNLSPVSGTNGSSTFGGTGTISVTSGAIYIGAVPTAASNWSTTNLSAPLQFGAAEGFIHAPISETEPVLVSSSISGTGGLTLSGRVRLGGNSSYTGQTTSSGRLFVGEDVKPGQLGPLGADISPVVFEAGSTPTSEDYGQSQSMLVLSPAAGGSMDFSRDLKFISHTPMGFGLIVDPAQDRGNVATVSGKIELSGLLQLHGKSPEARLLVSGDIRGTGSITESSDVILSGNNTFNGGLTIGAGALVAGSDKAFGAASLIIENDGTISAAGGARSLSNPVQLVTRFARIGGSEPITFTGSVNLLSAAHSLTITNSATTTFSQSISNGTLSKNGSGTLAVAGLNLRALHLDEGVVQVQAGLTQSHTSRVQALTIAPNSKLDLIDNDFILDYSGNAAVNDANVRSFLFNGQIYSSIQNQSHSIGYADNSDLGYATFGDVVVDATSVLFKYTYCGDANLDGKVDAKDLGALAVHWQETDEYWRDGDFNYDGIVDIKDLYALAINWHAGNENTLNDSLNALRLPSISVPEGGASGFIGIGMGLTLLFRRRRVDPAI